MEHKKERIRMKSIRCLSCHEKPLVHLGMPVLLCFLYETCPAPMLHLFFPDFWRNRIGIGTICFMYLFWEYVRSNVSSQTF